MNQNIGVRKNTKPTFGYGQSKPSRQSLVARGLAANEDKAGKRLQDQKIPMTKKPSYMFYNSSDSDADQVYSMNKKLDRCSSLLQKMTKGNDKTSAAKTPRGKDQKKENKKVVKIILPNANAITKPSVSGPNKSNILQKTKMATSTPNLKKKTKIKKKNEEELLQELSRVEMEKTLLQEQYSKLLQQHLTSTRNSPGSSRKDEDGIVPLNKESRAEPIISFGNQTEATPLRFESSDFQDASNSLTSSSVFQELEKTVAGISEKLSFPRSLTPSVNRSTVNGFNGFSKGPTRHEAEKDNFIPRNSSSTLTNSSRDFFPLLPSAQPTVAHNPKHRIYSSDSLEEASYCSSLSDSECDKTLIADSVHTLDTIDSDKSYTKDIMKDRSSKEPTKETSLITDHGEEDFVQQSPEPNIKTVRFQHVPSLDSSGSGNISSYEEMTDFTRKPPYYEACNPIKEANHRVSDTLNSRDKDEKSRMSDEKDEDEGSAVKLTPGDGHRKRRERVVHGNEAKISESKEANLKSEKSVAKSKKTNEISTNKKQFYESPNRYEDKSPMDVVSQLSCLKKSEKSHPKEPLSGSNYTGGIKPGFAATQITALSYLFRELTRLLSDRINSEEDRLLKEIDHMIGLLPFLINNLDPDLQTEIGLAVQPLRVENSDLRRQLRIANQKIRDFEVNIENLDKLLKEKEKHAVDEAKLERLRLQMNQDEAERKILKERVGEINKTMEELRGENQKLIQQIVEKDSEVLKQKRLWQKEKTSIYTEQETAKKKLESLSLALQGQEKQNRILQLSLSQSEAEIVRLKELNRDLRDSVANLLRDVNYKEPRMQNKSTFDKHHPAISSNDPDLQISPMEKSGHNDNYYTKSRRFKPPVTDTPLHTELSDKMHPIFGENGEINTKNTLHFDYDAGKNRLGSFSSLSDQNSEISSISSVPDLVTGSDHTSVGQSLFVGDQFSTLTCDSGEFRSDLANLSMKIRNMQESLQNAKRT